MSEFKASDPEVRDIAAVFALKGWTWTNKNGTSVDPFVPKASDIARALDRLYGSAKALSEGNGGNAHAGRLYVQYVTEGYGDEVQFGIEWTRL
jgi:hypothetical protein